MMQFEEKMSHPQGPHPSLFHFETTSRMMLPKGSSYVSPPLVVLLNSFEEKLSYSLNKLMASAKDNNLSLSWMKLAMESLCETHSDIKTLIIDLELPVSNWDDEWIDVYLNNSIKLLDLCNALSSEISRLRQGQLMLQCALQSMDSSAEKIVGIHRSLLRWKQHINAKNPRLENCVAILESIIASLNLPRIKNSAKGKVLMRAMYGVKVKTLFISGVFTAAFSGSSKKLVELRVPETLAWSDTFTRLQILVNGDIRIQFSNVNTSKVVKEFAAVDATVTNLLRLCQVNELSFNSEALEFTVSKLLNSAKEFSHGLNLFSTEVDNFFRIVLAGRDTLLHSLRSNYTTQTSPKKKHWATVK